MGSVPFKIFSSIFFSWRKCELQAIEKKPRTYGGLHPKSDVGRFYIPRKDGGRGLIAIEDCVEFAVRGLEMYAHGSEVRLIQAARGDGLEAASVLKKTKKKKKLQRLGGESFTWPVFETN